MSIRSQLHGHIVVALQTLATEHQGTEHQGVDPAGERAKSPTRQPQSVSEMPRIALVPPKLAAHGDYTTPVALALGRLWQRKPRDVAARLQALLGTMGGMVSRIDIAGPGHLNFFVDANVWRNNLVAFLQDPHGALQCPPNGAGSVLLEYVSANPTGPLHVAHGRGAVHGDVLARLLKAAGFDVQREYYINDMGRQTDVMAESIYLRYGELHGRAFIAPKDFYPGDYITNMAQQLTALHGEALLHVPKDTWLPTLRAFGIERMLTRIRADLAAFNVSFDHWVSEETICQDNILKSVIDRLTSAGHTFVDGGKTWFRSTTFGDDKDRVLLRDDGRPTYFLTDLAYHDAKARRGFARLINVWGADHGGYVTRIRSGLIALGHDGAKLEVLLIQMVSLSQGGEALRMGKRLGTAVWLDEVVNKAGSDATRYLFSMRRIDAQMEFDIDLAMRHSIENPVYYAQMGHARLAAIGRKAQEAQVALKAPTLAALASLQLPEEIEIMRTMARAPDVITDAAQALEPHQVVHYMQELIAQFHSYYTRYKNTEKVISADADKTQARLMMCLGLQSTLKTLLTLLGVSAPLQMHLPEAEEATEASEATLEETGSKP